MYAGESIKKHIDELIDATAGPDTARIIVIEEFIVAKNAELTEGDITYRMKVYVWEVGASPITRDFVYNLIMTPTITIADGEEITREASQDFIKMTETFYKEDNRFCRQIFVDYKYHISLTV